MEFVGSKKTSKQILNKRDSVMNSITCTHMYSQPCHQLLCFTCILICSSCVIVSGSIQFCIVLYYCVVTNCIRYVLMYPLMKMFLSSLVILDIHMGYRKYVWTDQVIGRSKKMVLYSFKYSKLNYLMYSPFTHWLQHTCKTAYMRANTG